MTGTARGSLWHILPHQKQTKALIPEGVTKIPYGMFYNCGALTEITIPEGVTYIGELAFARCGSLTEVILPRSVMTISQEAFADCSALTDVLIPYDVNYIGYHAFNNCDKLTLSVVAGSYADRWCMDSHIPYKNYNQYEYYKNK